jgi:hypothetical protein
MAERQLRRKKFYNIIKQEDSFHFLHKSENKEDTFDK